MLVWVVLGFGLFGFGVVGVCQFLLFCGLAVGSFRGFVVSRFGAGW